MSCAILKVNASIIQPSIQVFIYQVLQFSKLFNFVPPCKVFWNPALQCLNIKPGIQAKIWESIEKKYIEAFQLRNPDFLETPNFLNQKSSPATKTNTNNIISPLISQTTCISKLILVSLGSSKNLDSTE